MRGCLTTVFWVVIIIIAIVMFIIDQIGKIITGLISLTFNILAVAAVIFIFYLIPIYMGRWLGVLCKSIFLDLGYIEDKGKMVKNDENIKENNKAIRKAKQIWEFSNPRTGPYRYNPRQEYQYYGKLLPEYTIISHVYVRRYSVTKELIGKILLFFGYAVCTVIVGLDFSWLFNLLLSASLHNDATFNLINGVVIACLFLVSGVISACKE